MFGYGEPPGEIRAEYVSLIRTTCASATVQVHFVVYLKYTMVSLISMGVSFCVFCNIVYRIHKYKDVMQLKQDNLFISLHC